jgi:hypothetical protein
MTIPPPIHTEVATLSPETMAECAAAKKRLAEEEARMRAGDLIHDELTESRSWPVKRTNFHDL